MNPATSNHELYHTCHICGLEYNFWDYGYNCPECLQPKTVQNFNTMPIKKENIHLYPDDWKEISKDIRFNRARNRCENCGIINHSIITRLPDGFTRTPSPTEWDMITSRRKYSHDSYFGSLKHFGFFKVVLTVAHLDHDPTNNDYSNLKALCQKCHNNHDAAHRQQTRKAQPKNQLSFLFTLILLLSVTFANGQQSQQSQQSNKTAYLVTIKQTANPKTAVYKFTNTQAIDSLLTATFGKATPAAQMLKTSNYFEILTSNTWFYCEQKALKPNGKFKLFKLKNQ